MKDHTDDLQPRGVLPPNGIEQRASERAAGPARSQSSSHAAEGQGPGRDPGERSRDELLAVLAHELRTPLSAILAWTRMLIKGGLDPDTYARAVDSIDRNARLQARLLDDILEWSGILRGKMQLRKRRVDLYGVINSAIETLRPAADAKGIKFVIEGMHSECVDGDSDRLREIVWNLLSNAIKFGYKNGEVTIRVGSKGAYEEITVIDNGPGIATDFLPYVFEHYRRADSSPNTPPGLGLGLAIVKQLVELHGGCVSAANREDGHGAVFTVKIPAAAADAAPQHRN